MRYSSWLDDIRTAMEQLGGYADLHDLYPVVAELRTDDLPKTWKDIIRRTIHSHSSDSEGFEQEKEDTFYSVHGIGLGTWGLREFSPPTPQAVDIEPPPNTERVKQETYRILRDTELSRAIKLLHGFACQLCETRIELSQDEFYAEVHHIKPLGRPHNGPDCPGNVICVCPNCYVKLDYGGIPLSHEQLGIHARHAVSPQYIGYHNANIYRKASLQQRLTTATATVRKRNLQEHEL